jgi:hypothetical protein
LQYDPEPVLPSTESALFDQLLQDRLASADLAVGYLGSDQPKDHYVLGALRAFLTPTILLADEGYRFSDRVPQEYQPRVIRLGASAAMRKVVAREVAIFEQDYVDLEDQTEVEKYSQMLVSSGSKDGVYGSDVRQVFVEELVMRDKYVGKNVGAMGPGATATDVRFYEIWGGAKADLDLDELQRELAELRAAMKEQALSADQDVAVAEVAQAERAAGEGDGPTVLARLAAAGKWALDVATKIGTSIAAKAIQQSLGL